MPTIDFVANTTVIPATWLNDIDSHVFDDTTSVHIASAITNTPSGSIAATNVQTAIDELATEKANLASPAFTTAITLDGVAVPTISSTNTFTNKRITARVGSTTSSATPTINTDNSDIYRLTAQAVDITSFTTNLTGTPSHGDSLLVEITGTATRAITWGASFEASTVALPTTTVTTAMLSVAFLWNSATSKWRCVGAI